MNVVVSAGGRFHALRLAQQLAHKQSLLKLFTFDYTKADTTWLAQKHVQVIKSCQILNDLFVKFHGGRFINKARFNSFKDNLFDRNVSQRIATLQPFDIFVGWAHYALHSIPAARQAGAKIVIESGSCHIIAQQQLLNEEYRHWGINYNPISQATIQKMQEEYQMADFIMTLSSYAHDSFIAQGLPAHKILKVPCGIDVEHFLQPPQAHHPDKKFRVIFVGLVTLRKGIQYLLHAWNSLKLPINEAELIIVGQQQKDFASIAHTLPIASNVRFIGPTDRATLKTLYYQSTVSVLPSIEDGFGMVIGEAMACGLPVICTTNTAGPDIIKDFYYGFIVQPANVQALAEKIQWCFSHRAQAAEMGLHGKNHIQRFSWDAYGQKIFETYKNIAHSSKGNPS